MSSTTTLQHSTATTSPEAPPDTQPSPGATESPTSSILEPTEATTSVSTAATAAKAATTAAYPPSTPDKSTFIPNGAHRHTGNYDSKKLFKGVLILLVLLQLCYSSLAALVV